MTKKKVGRFLLKFFVACAFVLVSAYALFAAYGYQADLSFRHIQKTSIIDITNRYKNVRVFLNNQLQSSQLPDQIKGVLPGDYDLSITKVHFLPWHRNVRVESDVVTRVSDLLLVPEDLNPFIKTVTSFVGDVHFFMGRDAFAVVKPQQSYLTLVSFFADGTLRHNEVQLIRDDVQNVEFFPEGYFVVHFEKAKFLQVFDVTSLKSVSFLPPDVFDRFKVNFAHQEVYFMDHNVLARVSFDKLENLPKKEAITSEVASHVLQYVIGSKGIYYLQDGILSFTDFEGKQHQSLDRSTLFSNLSLRVGQNYDFLILRKGDERRLFALDKQNNILLLTTDLKDDYLLNQSDEVLFATSQHEIFYYDSQVQRKLFVRKMEGDLQLLGWYGEDYHFIFSEGKNLKLADMSFTNVYPLHWDGDFQNLSINDTSLYFLVDQKLKVLSFFSG